MELQVPPPYKEGKGSLSISQAARLYVVSKTTVYNRINRRRDQASYGIAKQRLTPEEEESIENWVVSLVHAVVASFIIRAKCNYIISK